MHHNIYYKDHLKCSFKVLKLVLKAGKEDSCSYSYANSHKLKKPIILKNPFPISSSSTKYYIHILNKLFYQTTLSYPGKSLNGKNHPETQLIILPLF